MSSVNVNNVLNMDGDALPDNLIPTTVSAWVSFDGVGGASIKDSYNVSSVGRNGEGDYTVNFLTPMPNADYVIMASCGNFNNFVGVATDEQTPATSSVRIASVDVGGAKQDSGYVYLAIVRSGV